MTLRPCFLLLPLAAAGCAHDGISGPAGALLIQAEVIGPTETIPGEGIIARVEIFNPQSRPVVFEGCAAVGLEPDDVPSETLSSRGCRGRRDPVPEFIGVREIPEYGSVVDTVRWRGLRRMAATTLRSSESPNLPAGSYRLRPVVRQDDDVVVRGGAQRVTLLPWTSVKVIHAATGVGALDLVVNGRVAVRDVAPGAFSTSATAEAGAVTLAFRLTGDDVDLGTSTAVLPALGGHLIAPVAAGSSIEPIAFTDASTVTGPSESRLRVAHLAAGAPALDIFRTQPDLPAPVRFMSPFHYGKASPYVSSGAGPWTVLVVTAGGADTLLATAPMPIPGGGTRTLVLTDQPGGGVVAALIEP
jgi:hypothetical protein